MERDQKLINDAVEFIKYNKSDLLDKFCDDCGPVSSPVTVFMAGSPGAGKTEVSIELVKEFNDRPIRIDADEIRTFCPGYTGDNAHLFQKAASRGVDILYKHALENNINCIVDGTFAHGRAIENIERSLKRGRKVYIVFVYQDPAQAWLFTKAREAKESRRILPENFVRGYFESQKNVSLAKRKFEKQIKVHVLVKNAKTGETSLEPNVDVNYIDKHLAGRYSEDELIRLTNE